MSGFDDLIGSIVSSVLGGGKKEEGDKMRHNSEEFMAEISAEKFTEELSVKEIVLTMTSRVREINIRYSCINGEWYMATNGEVPIDVIDNLIVVLKDNVEYFNRLCELVADVKRRVLPRERGEKK